MKLQRDTQPDRNLITAYGAGHVEINRQRHETSLVLLPDRLISPWAASGFAALQVSDFQLIADLAPEILLVGTGIRQRFPAPALLRSLIEARIGYEIMDSAAAARTYNVLMLEGRRVAAALLVE